MAFREIYEQNFRFVWRSLRRLGVAESDVADAVQDVFVVVHRKLPEYEGRGKITTWLFGVCIRVASDRRRSARARHEQLTKDGVIPSPERGDSLELGADSRAILESILDRMPEEQRIVFALFELEGLTGEEIAELLDVPVGTVRSRLRLARDCFQERVARLQPSGQWRESFAMKHRKACP